MSAKKAETGSKLAAHTSNTDPDVSITSDGPTPEAPGGKPEEMQRETVHAMGPDVRALDEMIEETLERDETWAKARTDAGADGDALERAMRCAMDAAREHGAYADGPLQWVERPHGGHPEFTPMLRITMLGNVRRAGDLNEALADALAGDDEAMHASMKHRMILFISGPTKADTTKATDSATENGTGEGCGTSAQEQQDQDWIKRLMAYVPRGAQKGQKLARGIVHPWCYRRAGAEEDENGWDDPGWRALYRIMVLAIEEWCAKHPKKAKRMAQTMTLDAMLWLSYKEKWGAMRWEIHARGPQPRSLSRALGRMEWMLEVVSARMCQRCGRPAHIRAPRETNDKRRTDGWVNNVCNRCHRRHRHHNRQSDDARWETRHDGSSTRGNEPPSKAEVDAETDRYLTSLGPDRDDRDPWGYDRDVVKEWEARNEADREQRRETWPEPAASYRIQSAPPTPQPKAHQVRLGRWRYEEGEVTVQGFDGEDAAAKACEVDPKWRESAQVSGAFVLGVDTAGDGALRTELRIEERHGETAMLEAVLAERTESAQARARKEQDEEKGKTRGERAIVGQ